MGQFQAAPVGHADKRTHIIELFDRVWASLEDDVKSAVLNHLMMKEPHRFQSTLVSATSAALTLEPPLHSPSTMSGHATSEHGQQKGRDWSIAPCTTLTPLPEVVKAHFVRCNHDPVQFFDRQGSLGSSANLVGRQFYLALVHSKNTDWLGHVQLRFLTVGFYELQLHVSKTCQKRHPGRWVKRRLVEIAQACQPDRAEDEVESEVANFLCWGRRYYQLMADLSTAAVARLSPQNRTE